MKTAAAWIALVCSAIGIFACTETPPSKFNTNGDPPNERCETADVCVVWGWCGEKVDGTGPKECVAVSDEKCRASRACKVSGLCSFVNNRCVAKSDADCENSQYCQWNGLCSESEGLCR
ncbi:MAG: hypothetical protein U0414_07115 [Polyangiaceae bacterium]